MPWFALLGCVLLAMLFRGGMSFLKPRACSLVSARIANNAGISSSSVLEKHVFKQKALRAVGAKKMHRLERIISNRGLGSRGEVSKMLKQGRVEIDGQVVRSGSAKYPIDVEVEVDGEAVMEIPLMACYHKPVGVHSTLSDQWGRADLQDLQEQFTFLKTMHPVGRLDADTSGLLLFSKDGQLTNVLLHPSTGVEREYEAVVVGKVDFEILSKILRDGVQTTDGTFAADLLEARILEGEVSVPEDIGGKYDSEGEDSDESGEVGGAMKSVRASYVRLAVREGKYRMVRRILHNSGGHSVINLHRVRYGGLQLGELEEGEVRSCTMQEKEWAVKLCKSKASGRVKAPPLLLNDAEKKAK